MPTTRETKVVQVLLKITVDADSRDHDGYTLLSHAAIAGHQNILLKIGVDEESMDNKGRTPSSRAAGLGQQNAVNIPLMRAAGLGSG